MMFPFYLLIAIMPLVRHSFWSYTSLAGLSMNKWLGLAALTMACFHLTVRRTPPRPFRTPQASLFVLFGVMVILSFLLRGPEKVAVELSPVGNWVSFLLLFFMTFMVVDSRRHLKWTLFFAIGGIAFASLHLLREWQGYGGMGEDRPGWVTGDPNYFALSALTCLPLAFLFSEVRLPQWQRVAVRSCLAVILAAFVLAASRGGMIGLAVSFVMVAWNSRRRAQFLSVGGGLLFLLILVAPSSPLKRVLDPGQAEVSSTDTHLMLLRGGLRMFQDHFVLGIGVGNFKWMIEQYVDPAFAELAAVAHNTFLEVACELGVVGLLLLLTLIFFTFRTLRRVRIAAARGRDPLLHLVARGVEAGLAGACVAMFFVSALHSRLFWFLVILTMCLPAIPAPSKPARRGGPVSGHPPREAAREPSARLWESPAPGGGRGLP